MKKAFTLIEILIVVVVLGILSAIVVPSFSDVADGTRVQADQNNAREISKACKIYLLRHPEAETITLENLVDEKILSEEPRDPWGDRKYTINEDFEGVPLKKPA